MKSKAAPLSSHGKPTRGTPGLLGVSGLPIVYFNMPKAACTTIKNILFFLQHKRWHPEPLGIHREIKTDAVLLRGAELDRQRADNTEVGGCFAFTFVRDPGHRAYSAFVEKIWATGPYSFPRIRKHMRQHYDFSLDPLGSDKAGSPLDTRESVGLGFKQFLHFAHDNLAGRTPFTPNPHWASQLLRIRQLPLGEALSLIGRVESFAEDMAFVLRKAGCQNMDILQKRFNEGPPPPFKFNDVLDEQARSLLMNLYQHDYHAFGYRLPQPTGENASQKNSVITADQPK